MLNLYALQYFVDHEINTEKKEKKKAKKKKKSFLGYLTNPYEYVYVNIFNIVD